MEGEQPMRARRYVRLPEDCISLCTENLGIQTSRDVTSALVEDVSFRIRQVTKLALEFMKHANRKRVCKEDFDHALKWSGIEPLYGHNVDPPPFMYIHENGLYSVEDQEVMLQDLSLSPAVPAASLPPPPSLSAHWLLVEGFPVDMEGTQHGMPTTVQLKKPFTESHQRYLSLLMEAITGDSEELRRIALSDVQTNPAIANILPDLVQYLLETLSCWVQFSPLQLTRVLTLLYSLFMNKHLFLDPYGTGLFPLVKSIILTPSYQHTGPVLDHWHVRRMSAMCLAEIVACCGTSSNEYVPDIYALFRQLLSQSEISLRVLYGVVLSLCQLGGKSLADVLFPRLDAISQYVQSFFTAKDVELRDTALRIHEALLLSAEILLMSGVTVEVKPKHTSSATTSSFSSSRHCLASQLPGSGGRHESNFLSSFVPAEKSIMDTCDLSLGGPQQQQQQDMPTLYEFLVDLFGEKLVQRMTAHVRNLYLAREKRCPVKIEVTAKEPTRTTDGMKRPPRDDTLVNFLKREGFQSCRVQLPLKLMPRKPPAYHPWGRQLWRFQIRTTVLPVWTNMLEEKGQGTWNRQRRGAATLPEYFRRRPVVKRTCHAHTFDVGAIWL